MKNRIFILIHSILLTLCIYWLINAISHNDIIRIILAGVCAFYNLYLWIYSFIAIIKEDFPAHIKIEMIPTKDISNNIKNNIQTQLNNINKILKK